MIPKDVHDFWCELNASDEDQEVARANLEDLSYRDDHFRPESLTDRHLLLQEGNMVRHVSTLAQALPTFAYLVVPKLSVHTDLDPKLSNIRHNTRRWTYPTRYLLVPRHHNSHLDFPRRL